MVERKLIGGWIAAGAVLGTSLLLTPGVVSRAGFSGRDTLATRLAGAMTLAYPVGFMVARRPDARRPALFGVLGWNGATLLACALGRRSIPKPVSAVLLIDSTVFIVGALWLLRRDGTASLPLARPGVVALGFALDGVIALTAGGRLGRFVGAPGTDDLLYRLAGAGSLGVAAASLGATGPGRRPWAGMVAKAVASAALAVALEMRSKSGG